MELLNKRNFNKIILNLEKKESIYKDKSYLNTNSFPETFVGREQKIEKILSFLISYKHDYVVPLVSVYGRSGSGKSSVTRFVCENINDASYIYVDLRKAKTVFRGANLILSELGQDGVPNTQGLNQAIERIGDSIKARLGSLGKKFFLLVLDEADVLFNDTRGNPSDFIYNLLLTEEKLQEDGYLMSIITISNNLIGNYFLDDRVKSRIGTSEVYFEPYSKDEVLEILQQVSKKTYNIELDSTVLERCAQLCSAEHGDARRAINLLRCAVENAVEKSETVNESHVESADSELQMQPGLDFFSSASYHIQRLCIAIARLSYLTDELWQATSTLYKQYCGILRKEDKPLGYRRVSDLLSELVQAGFVVSREESKGRGGYGKLYKITFPPYVILEKYPENFNRMKDFKKKYYDLTHDPQYKGSFDLKLSKFYDEKRWQRYVNLDFSNK